MSDTSLHQWQGFLDRVRRPIDFALRNQTADESTVKHLPQYLSGEISSAFHQEFAKEPEYFRVLALLQNLFRGYGVNLPREKRQARLREAVTVIDRFRKASGKDNEVASIKNQAPNRQAWPAPSLPKESSPASADTMTEPPNTLSVRYIKGIGPKRAALLQHLGVETVEDALWYLPWRYEDRSLILPIAQVQPGQVVTVSGVVQQTTVKRTNRQRLSLLEVTLADSTGSLPAIFFNQLYLEEQFTPGTRVMLSGMVSLRSQGRGRLQLESPEYEVLGEGPATPLHVGRVVPIYHESKGLTNRFLRGLLKALLVAHRQRMPDPLPSAIRKRYGLPALADALMEVHFPDRSVSCLDLLHRRTPAQRRLAFQELFLLEVALALRRHHLQGEERIERPVCSDALMTTFLDQLPFRLTAAQSRVLKDICHDMTASSPMNRLIQGDVGCGKTIVAMSAAVRVCSTGQQAAFMVPTELLAEQHYRNFRTRLEAIGIRVALIRGGMRAKEKREILAAVAEGAIQIVIGTHAIFQNTVRFARLGFVVIDEQHRFGVLQRKALVEKGSRPDVLVMTATPIPRTLAMTVYGDLDVSVIDALPPGRQTVRSFLFSSEEREEAYRLVHEQVRLGHQAYMVYPLVEESEKVDLQAAVQAAEELQAGPFKTARVGILHGRMPAEERDATMAAFQRGEIQVLVATTVIEVGVDVPNATIVMIEHAERFGLAQLHQLRGRVGRSRHQAYCLLVTSKPNPARRTRGRQETDLWAHDGDNEASLAQKRLGVVLRSSDGFYIAEQDLLLRGPGEFLGVRQWGLPLFRAANLVQDVELLASARDEAFSLVARDPQLVDVEHRPLRDAVVRAWKGTLSLGGIG
jgi:ATP-dependent DNA helicase RecG